MENNDFRIKWYQAINERNTTTISELIKKFRDRPEIRLYVEGLKLVKLLRDFPKSDDTFTVSARIYITGMKITDILSKNTDLLKHSENLFFLSYLVKANFLHSVLHLIDAIDLETLDAENRALIYVNKGIAQYRLGLYSSAIDSLSKALESEETRGISITYTFLSLIERDVNSGKQFYKEKANEMTEEVRLDCKAIIKFYDGKYEETINDLEEAWARFGLYSELIHYIGKAYDQLGFFNEARKLYLTSFYSNNGIYMNALISYVKLLMRLGEYKLAEFYARMGVFLGDNTEVIALYELDLLRRLKKDRNLKEYIKEKLSKIFPGIDFCEKTLKEIFEKNRTRGFLEGVEEKPESVIYALWKLQKNKDDKIAEEILTRIIEAKMLPDEWIVRAYEGLSLIEMNRNNFSSSLSFVEEGLKICPDDEELLLLKIRILLSLGMLEEARQTFSFLGNISHNREIKKRLKKLEKKFKENKKGPRHK